MNIDRYVPTAREAELLALLDATLRVLDAVVSKSLRSGGIDFYDNDTLDEPTNELKNLEREALISALNETHGSQKRAAALLGISPRVMNYRLRAYGLRRKDLEGKAGRKYAS